MAVWEGRSRNGGRGWGEGTGMEGGAGVRVQEWREGLG